MNNLKERIAWKYDIIKDLFAPIPATYFPEYQNHRKAKYRILLDKFWHALKYGRRNRFYFLYGFDIKGFRNESQYVEYDTFRNIRTKLNEAVKYNPIFVLRDKYFFGIVAKELGIRTPQILGIVHEGLIFNQDQKEDCSFEDFFSCHRDVFLKRIAGECADGVYHLVSDGDKLLLNGKDVSITDLERMVGLNGYLIQEKIRQCSEVSHIYPNSINTIRLTTVKNKSSIDILPPLLRVGTHGNNVDNWAVGGLAIGIDPDKGCLKRFGFYKPQYGRKTEIHPDTGIVFEGYMIPYIRESIEMAKYFHNRLPDVHSIGWDIAITEEGPCFIEGNDNWEISLVQACNGGLMKEFNSLFRNK